MTEEHAPLDPYELLGVPRDASEEAITAAYRRAAFHAHPDRNGGDTARMQALNEARDLLLDREARARFDAGEGRRNGPSLEEKARQFLLGIWRNVIRDRNTVHQDAIAILAGNVTNQRMQLKATRADCVRDLAGLRERLHRLKGPPENFLAGMIESEITRGEAQLPVMDEDERVMAKALELLRGFSYDTRGQFTVLDVPALGSFATGLLGPGRAY